MLLLVLAAVVAAMLGAMLGAGHAAAHQRADVSVVSPSEGQSVAGERVEVVLAAAGGELGQVEFTVRLDGRPVDTSGAVGGDSLFTTFSLRSGERASVRIAVSDAGEHELRVVYAADGDDPKPDVVRRFSSGARRRGAPLPLIAVVAAGSAVVAVAVVVRRRRGPRR